MRYRPAVTFKRGRVFAQLQLINLNLPRVEVFADGECVTVALSYGNGSSDPVALVDVTLSGTRTGKAVAAAYWRIREWRGR